MKPPRLCALFLLTLLAVLTTRIRPSSADTGPNDITTLIEDPFDHSALGNRTPVILVPGIHCNQMKVVISVS